MLLAVLALACACASGPDPEAYKRAVLEVDRDYLAAAERRARDEQGAFDPNAPREERLRRLVQATRNTADELDALAGRAAALKPPPVLKNWHDIHVEFFRGQAERWRAYGAAMETHDRLRVREAGKEIDRFTIAQLDKLLAESERIAADAPDLRDHIRQMRQGLAASAR